MGEHAPIAPIILARIGQEARLELGQDDQRHEIRTFVRRGESGYTVLLRHVTNDVVMIDREVALEPGISAKVAASTAVIRLDLETEQEMRAKQRAGVDLTTTTGCLSI